MGKNLAYRTAAMTIKFSEPSKLTERVLAEYLSSSSAHPGSLGFNFDTQEISISPPCGVYTIDANSLMRDDALDGARQFAQRYFIFERSILCATADIGEVDGSLQVLGFNYKSPVTLASIEILKNLETRRTRVDDAPEFRLLFIRSFNFAAVWLHGGAGQDVYVPISPDHSGILRHGQIYATAALNVELKKYGAATRSQLGR